MKKQVIVRYLKAYILPLVINPFLVNLGILSYLSRTHGDIFSHDIHFLLRCIYDILCTTKQTAAQLIICRNLIPCESTNSDGCG